MISLFIIFVLLGPIPSLQGTQYSEKLVIANSNGSFTDSYAYFTYQNMTEYLQGLQKNYSDIISVSSLGKTYQGRDIWMVKISDNVTQEETEPGVLLMGAHHGCEQLSYEVLLYFITYLIKTYTNTTTNNNETEDQPSLEKVKEIVNTTQIYIIPMVNPDGVEAITRKNCDPNYGPFGLRNQITSYGVDLNRNYGYKWFSWFVRPWSYPMMSQLRDSSDMYRGNQPFSENETKAIKNFVESNNISISVSYHNSQQCILYPWWYNMISTRDTQLFRSVGTNISHLDGYTLYGRNLLLGYRGSPGTSEDWLYGAHGILAFCIELGYSAQPDLILNMCKKEVNVGLYICDIAGSIHTKQKDWVETHQRAQ